LDTSNHLLSLHHFPSPSHQNHDKKKKSPTQTIFHTLWQYLLLCTKLVSEFKFKFVD